MPWKLVPSLLHQHVMLSGEGRLRLRSLTRSIETVIFMLISLHRPCSGASILSVLLDDTMPPVRYGKELLAPRSRRPGRPHPRSTHAKHRERGRASPLPHRRRAPFVTAKSLAPPRGVSSLHVTLRLSRRPRLVGLSPRAARHVSSGDFSAPPPSVAARPRTPARSGPSGP